MSVAKDFFPLLFLFDFYDKSRRVTDKITGARHYVFAGHSFQRLRRPPSSNVLNIIDLCFLFHLFSLHRRFVNMASGRKDFLSQPAPENYVAGLGRGATGFTTRSDLGPAREGPTPEQIQAALAKRAQLLGAAPPTAYGAGREKGGKDEEKEEEEDERFQDPDNEVGLFAYGQFDQDDDEADRIYDEVDEKMDKRRRARRLVPSPSFSPKFDSFCSSGSPRLFWTVDRLEYSPPIGKLANSKSKKNTNERTPKSSNNSPT